MIEAIVSKWVRVLGQLSARYASSTQNVRFGQKVTLYGAPIITTVDQSSVMVGHRAVLCSDSRFTALGVSKPVVIRTLRPGATIVIGDDVGMSGTTICSAVSISVGDRCLLGADTTIVDTDFHPVHPALNRRFRPLPAGNPSDAVTIESDVFIGYGAVVLKGVRIGSGSVIGAKSVVTRDIPPFSIASGVPARVIGAVPGVGS